jgi:Zn-dependent M28 family amino/carboxypeptidase
VLDVINWLALLFSVPFLLMMFVMTLYRMLSPKTDSPGTDDNGSGTALVMSLAQRFSAEPTENVDLFFGWWGAEEMGLFGSRQFVRQAHEKLDKNKLHVINADCVGVGEYLTVHTGQGTINRKAAEPSTVRRLEKAAQENGVQTSRSWESIISGGSSDQAGWIDRGFKNTSLILRANKQKLSLPSKIVAAILRIGDAAQYELDHIHTSDDTLETIKPDVLESSTDVAEAYIRAVDTEQGITVNS